ncbi:MAG: OsmC family protein [Bacteroidota bacterium]|nr:OsmC family protein [Candidatus Kapabacteria bacterium]MDW8219522.1 OsmC family protein [Bacteroidota bacterium]
MVSIHIEYEGDLHCRLTHGPSQTTITTDAPIDNHGRGESFSPTDLVAAGLGSCMATVMAIAARNRHIELQGMRIHVQKEMASQPRRIRRLGVEILLPPTVESKDLKFLENAARTCPVHQSLHPDIQIDLTLKLSTSSDAIPSGNMTTPASS